MTGSRLTLAPRSPSLGRRVRRACALALGLLSGVVMLTGLVLPASDALAAATRSALQCNNVGPSASGATTGMTCTVTVVNTIDGGARSSTTTLTRTCSLGPCPGGNGTFVTRSTSLVTAVNQCNGSDNDAAHPITCRVVITNYVSADTPGARPVTAATSNQCVGSGQGGGGTVACDPVPASTTGATVTQCNGSGNGGGGTVACTVASASSVSPAVPIRVNQCNGTGNPGGSVVTCRTSISTQITAFRSGSGTTGTSQVTRIPTGGVQAGDGSTAGLRDAGLLTIGGALLLAGVLGAAYRRRLALGADRLTR